jgi:hypothetical protein
MATNSAKHHHRRIGRPSGQTVRGESSVLHFIPYKYNLLHSAMHPIRLKGTRCYARVG